MAPGEHGIELLVQRVAYKVAKTLPPSVQIEDLFQSGMIGWMIAKSKYDDSFAIPFNRFAVIYIHGAMIDSLRQGSWAPRHICKYQRLINEAKKELIDQDVYDPTDKQLAEYLNIPLSKYQKIAADLINIYLDELEEDLPSEEDIYEQVEEQYRDERLHAAIDALPIIQRKLINMHYNEDIYIAEIARRFNVTEVEGRKIFRNSLTNLKRAMSDWSPPD